VIGDFRLALGFLTRVPVSLVGPVAPDAMARSMRLFPLIGALIGAMTGAIYLLAARLLPPLPAALLAIAFGMLLTGALHEDGLADCADGFGGGRDKDGKLAIMRDSRVGAYGALALILSVSLRASALISLNNPAGALIAAHCLSRVCLPGLMLALPPASATGLAASAGRPSPAGVAVGLLVAALICAPLLRLHLAAVAAAAALASMAMALLARRQIGGYSGDVLGATEQVVEIAVLLVILALP